ncbi:ATP-binding protein [Thermomonospora catenispora]|nr:ATP-binding protein [Thermomonospora catenispora]
MADVPDEHRGRHGDEPVRSTGDGTAAPRDMIGTVPNGSWAVQVLLCATFPAAEEQVRRARRTVRQVLAACPEFDSGDAELLVSELAGNAVRHSGSRMFGLELARTWNGALRIALADDGRGVTTPHLRVGGLSDTGGRGLRLVEELASRWGMVRARGGGQAVWCELDRAPRPHAAADLPFSGLRPYGHAVPAPGPSWGRAAAGRW